MTANRHILVVDDDPEMGQFIAHVARGLGNDCAAASNSDDLLSLLRNETALIFLDLKMPGKDGIQVLRLLAERGISTRVVLMTGLSKRLLEAAEALAVELGVTVAGLLKKPFSLAALERILTHTIEPHALSTSVQHIGVALDDAELIEAVETNQFVLHYQPQVSVASREVVGFEALVRWEHPTKGLIFPDAFLQSVENLKLMDRLGYIVANRGLSDALELGRMLERAFTLSLNISASSLSDLSLPDTLATLAEDKNVEPEDIIIEVTESALLRDLSRTLEVLIRLRLHGFQISIDDFGTGYAVMEHLRHIPATELKIDRSFVTNMHVNSSDRIVVEKTIEIGHELGMKVIAEGVENEIQLRFLQDVRCDIAQGYLFSRPLPMKELALWLTRHKAANHFAPAS